MVELIAEIERRISQDHYMYEDAKVLIIKVINPSLSVVRILEGRSAGLSGLAFTLAEQNLPFVPCEYLSQTQSWEVA